MVEKIVNEYKCENKMGLTPKEVEDILSKFPKINMDKFERAIWGNTCTISESGDILHYHYDIIKAIKCGLENRNLMPWEWD